MISSLISVKDVRRFGLIALIFFCFLCIVAVFRHKTIPLFIFGAFCCFGIAFALAPEAMMPVYKGWIKIARGIGQCINTAILVLAFYVVITPIGLCIRVVKGPLLPLRPDPGLRTYWKPRLEPAQKKERFLKRY